MFNPFYDITIGSYRFSRIQEIEVNKSVTILGRTATIKLPTSAVLRQYGQNTGRIETAMQFKIGDKMEIKCGYEGISNNTEFKGFVSEIYHEDPARIVCMDNAWLLSRVQIKQDYIKTSLKAILNDVLTHISGIKLDTKVPDVQIDKYYIFHDGLGALKELATNYGLDIYFEDDILYAHLPYTRFKGMATYYLSGDKSNVAEINSLKYVTEADKKVRIKAVYIHSDNTRTEAMAGDPDGADERTLFFYNLPSGSDLKAIAESEIKRYRYNGYEGVLKGFHVPLTEPGHVAKLIDPQYNREGIYFVDSTKLTGNTEGLFRTINIGLKL